MANSDGLIGQRFVIDREAEGITHLVLARVALADGLFRAEIDSPAGANGPQAGLVANPTLVALGGTGTIQDEIIVVINLSLAQGNLDFLSDTELLVEFGSSAAFLRVPTPGSLAIFGVAGVCAIRRRR